MDSKKLVFIKNNVFIILLTILVIYLIGAVKKTEKEIATLQTENNNLQSEVQKLSSDIDDLSSTLYDLEASIEEIVDGMQE